MNLAPWMTENVCETFVIEEHRLTSFLIAEEPSQVGSNDEDDYADDEEEDDNDGSRPDYIEAYMGLSSAERLPTRQPRVRAAREIANSSMVDSDSERPFGLSRDVRQSMLAAFRSLSLPAMGNEYDDDPNDPDNAEHQPWFIGHSHFTHVVPDPMYEEGNEDLPPLEVASEGKPMPPSSANPFRSEASTASSDVDNEHSRL